MKNEPSPHEILKRAFPGIPDAETGEMIAASKRRTYPSGAIICREGAFENSFFILLKGEVRVTKVINESQERHLKNLGPGDFFGEMAIINNAPRAATITAITDVSVLEMRRETFQHFLERSSSMSMAMMSEVSRRLRQNDTMAIDDLRTKARELADAYQQLAEQEAARRDFLTTIAHEARTPLMAANGFMQFIRSGKMQGEALTNALDTVARNLQEINALVNDLLFLQEMDLIPTEMQPADIGSLVASAVEQQHAHARQNGVGLQINIPSGLPTILADARGLSRAFTAILDNAIKFSPDGGGVIVDVGHDENTVWVRVEDHGVGITPDVMPRIFDRFFHVDQVGEHLFRGIGLGLSITRQVIEQHHGQVLVTSEPGKGSTFTIRLPRFNRLSEG